MDLKLQVEEPEAVHTVIWVPSFCSMCEKLSPSQFQILDT